MKILISALMINLYVIVNVNAENITIIESQTGNPWAVQDTVWQFVAQGMGHTATIVPQSTLDDYANLSTTDVLIVSSGTINFTLTNHLATIKQFILSGRPAYIQSEYLNTYQGNITFDSIMQEVGADFQWIETISGSLVPMNVLGSFATTPNAVSTINYFNYGYAGTGNGVEKFLEYEGNYFGFCYSDISSGNGIVITISDEDWVWKNESPELMENILYKLLQSEPVAVDMIHVNPSSLHVFPNPFSQATTLQFNSELENAEITVFNSHGQMLKIIKNVNGDSYMLHREELATGLVFLTISQEEKMIGIAELMITDH